MTDDPIDPQLQEIAQRVFDAARAGDADTLAAYLDAGVPANLTNGTGDTLVMLAAYHGHVEAVQLLIERGAEVNRLNDRGQSPVAGAIFKGEDAVVRALAAAGADPHAGHPTAVDSARMFGREDYLELWGSSRS
ncbi:ankyrin repeat domain-containing protein [Rhodococcus kronopolitis]|uniref:Ankyrin repeat domain-containing protein n=1 Tax=Rhodococcus kronopolitis TaxID=1460226 RepID=A0ABV9FVU1_9NOCA